MDWVKEDVCEEEEEEREEDDGIVEVDKVEADFEGFCLEEESLSFC